MMGGLDRRLHVREKQRPALTIPQADAPVETLGFLEWLYLGATLPVGDPARARSREVHWTSVDVQRGLRDKRAIRDFCDALPSPNRKLLLEALRIKVNQATAASSVHATGGTE